MTNEHQRLAVDLLQRALDGTEHPARAVSILMSAAGTILQRSFGDAAAIDLMTAARWPRRRASALVCRDVAKDGLAARA